MTDYETAAALCTAAMIAMPAIALALIVGVEVMFKSLDLIDWLRG